MKGLLALAASLGISFGYKFDVFDALFPNNSNDVTGKLLTAFVIAGGSAGALAIFQSYLGIGKKSRDAIIEARKAEAAAAKEVAELSVAEAKAKRDKAEAEKRAAGSREAEAAAAKEVAELSAAKAKQPVAKVTESGPDSRS